MKKLTYITIFCCLFLLAGCFKKVSNDTVFIIKPNLQSQSGESGSLPLAEGAVALAWFDRTEQWSLTSYDNALAGILTDTESGEVETAAPDARSETLDDEGREGWLRLETRSASVLMAVIYPAEQMYAWRVYKTAENLSPTYLTVQFRPWKNGAYDDGGWHVSKNNE